MLAGNEIKINNNQDADSNENLDNSGRARISAVTAPKPDKITLEIKVEKCPASSNVPPGLRFVEDFYQFPRETVLVSYQGEGQVKKYVKLEPIKDLNGFELFGLTVEEAVAKLKQPVPLADEKEIKQLRIASPELSEEAAKAAYKAKKDKQRDVRRMVGMQIRHDLMENQLPEEMRSDKFDELKDNYVRAEANLKTVSENLNRVHFSEDKPDSLGKLMFNLHKENKIEAYDQLIKAKQEWLQADIALEEHCCSLDIFNQYVSQFSNEQLRLSHLVDAANRPILSALDAIAFIEKQPLIIYSNNQVKQNNASTTEMAKPIYSPIHHFSHSSHDTGYAPYGTRVLYDSGHYYLLLDESEVIKIYPQYTPKDEQVKNSPRVSSPLASPKQDLLRKRPQEEKVDDEEDIYADLVLYQIDINQAPDDVLNKSLDNILPVPPPAAMSSKSKDSKREESSPPQQDKTKEEIPKPDRKSYVVSLSEIVRRQWQDRYYHEILNAIFKTKKDPAYLWWIQVLLGPHLAVKRALRSRESRQELFEETRRLIQLDLYQLIHKTMIKQFKKECQKTILALQEAGLKRDQEKELKQLSQDAEYKKQALEGLQNTIRSVPEYKKSLDDIAELERKIQATTAEKGGNCEEALGYQKLISIERNNLSRIESNKSYISILGSYQDKESKRRKAVMSAEEELRLCKLRHSEQLKEFVEIKNALTAVSDYCDFDVIDGKWVPGDGYLEKLGLYIQQVETGRHEINMREVNEATDKPNQVWIDCANRYLKLFKEYEEKHTSWLFITIPLSVKSPDKNGLKALITKEYDLSKVRFINDALEHLYSKIDGVSEDKKSKGSEYIKMHFDKTLELTFDEYFTLNEWEKGSEDFFKWIKSMGSFVDKFKKTIQERNPDVYDESKLIQDYGQAVNQLVTNHKHTMGLCFAGKPKDWIIDYVAQFSETIGECMQMFIVDPANGNTLLHWVSQIFSLPSTDVGYQDSLIAIMVLLFRSGCRPQVKNNQGIEACNMDAITFKTSMAWAAITAILETLPTVSEFSEKLRTKLFEYTHSNLVIERGRSASLKQVGLFEQFWFTLKYHLTSSSIRLDRVPKAGRLIQQMIIASDTHDDSPVIALLNELSTTRDWRTGRLSSSQFRNIAGDFFDNQYRKYKVICFGGVIHGLDAAIQSEKTKENTEKMKKLEEENYIKDKVIQIKDKEKEEIQKKADEQHAKDQLRIIELENMLKSRQSSSMVQTDPSSLTPSSLPSNHSAMGVSSSSPAFFFPNRPPESLSRVRGSSLKSPSLSRAASGEST